MKLLRWDEAKREPYIYYILRFDDLTSLVSFAKTVDYQMETSELYKMNDQHYLNILVDVEDHPSLSSVVIGSHA